jgi:hypothetical protein
VPNAAATCAWARLIKQIYEVAPPGLSALWHREAGRRGHEQPAGIEKILTPLGLWPTLARSPPVASSVAA